MINNNQKRHDLKQRGAHVTLGSDGLWYFHIVQEGQKRLVSVVFDELDAIDRAERHLCHLGK